MLADTRRAAPDLARFIGELGPFSQASIPALRTLGDAADVGRPALERSRPLIRDLSSFADDAGPVSKNLDDLTASFDETGGVERFLDYLFFQMTAINGFDGISHYLRAGLITNLCSSYAIEPVNGCNANFGTHRGRPQRRQLGQDATRRSSALREALAGGVQLFREGDGAEERPGHEQRAARDARGGAPPAERPADQEAQREAGPRTRSGAVPSAAARRTSTRRAQSPEEQALDYLLGNDG